MSIDLNTAEEQSNGTGKGAVPPDSIVLLQMTIRQATNGKQGSAPLLTRAQSGMEYLNCEFEVVQGSYKGAKFWNNLNVSGASTSGQKTAVDISMRTIRAMVEASRGVHPKDSSPQAAQARILQDWSELQGIYFPAMLDCEISDPDKNGKRWVNNKLKRVITPDKEEEFAHICNGGEIITANPLPVIEDAPASAKPDWAAKQPAPAPAPAQAATPRPAPTPAPRPAPAAAPNGQQPVPSWGQTPPPATPPDGAPF